MTSYSTLYFNIQKNKLHNISKLLSSKKKTCSKIVYYGNYTVLGKTNEKYR